MLVINLFHNYVTADKFEMVGRKLGTGGISSLLKEHLHHFSEINVTSLQREHHQ